MNDDWVDAKVQVQGDSLVVSDATSGDSLVVPVRKLFERHARNAHPDYPYERLESIFGEEVFDA